MIKGEWTLSSVTYNQAGTYAVTLLNDATGKNVSKEVIGDLYLIIIQGYIQFQKQDVQKAIVILFLPLMRLMLSQGTMISSLKLQTLKEGRKRMQVTGCNLQICLKR